MKTQNMLDYIGDKMDALDFDGDLDLNWDKQAHVIELEMTMYVDAAEGFEVEDQDGEEKQAGDEVDYASKVKIMPITIWRPLAFLAKMASNKRKWMPYSFTCKTYSTMGKVISLISSMALATQKCSN